MPLEPPATPRLRLSDYPGRWIVVACEPRRETRLIQDLGYEARILFFRPAEHIFRIERDAKGRDHRRKILRPLFPGYVSFCCGDDHEEQDVCQHRFVLSVIRVANQAKFIREITAIGDWFDEHPTVRSVPLVTEGQSVLVTGGVFKGMSGIVVDAKRPTLVTITLELLRKGLPVEIPPEMITPV